MAQYSSAKVPAYLAYLVFFVLVVKCIFVVFPETDVCVHARARIHGYWLWHHSSYFAVLLGDVFHYILVSLGTICGICHVIKFDVDFTLACSSYFMVVIITQNS